MPVLCIDLSLQSDMELGEEKKIDVSPDLKPNFLELHRDQQYTLIVGTKRKNYSQSLKAHCPKFHRAKDEGWFLILGDIDRRELLALKRVAGINGPRKIHYLQFTAPPNPCKYLFIFFYTKFFYCTTRLNKKIVYTKICVDANFLKSLKTQ